MNNCSSNQLIEFSYNSPVYRIFTTLCLSSFIISLSLINVLTSFLANAYSEKRIVTLTNREKCVFVWIAVQLIVAWVCTANWRSYIVVSPVIFVVLITVHFYLYYKHGRDLYLQLRRRRLDLWYEDEEAFKKLDRMCEHYKKSSILYITCVSLLCVSLVCCFVMELLDVLIRGSCVLNVFLIQILVTLSNSTINTQKRLIYFSGFSTLLLHSYFSSQLHSISLFTFLFYFKLQLGY